MSIGDRYVLIYPRNSHKYKYKKTQFVICEIKEEWAKKTSFWGNEGEAIDAKAHVIDSQYYNGPDVITRSGSMGERGIHYTWSAKIEDHPKYKDDDDSTMIFFQDVTGLFFGEVPQKPWFCYEYDFINYCSDHSALEYDRKHDDALCHKCTYKDSESKQTQNKWDGWFE